jgi:hypothetical protein
VRHPTATLLLALCATLTAHAAARAEDGASGFQLPSKTIGCVFGGKDMLECDIAEHVNKRASRADCVQRWGRGFVMNTHGTASRACGGDSIIDSSLPVLADGTTWQRGGFVCRSEQATLTCTNADQHGFSLSRTDQKVF